MQPTKDQLRFYTFTESKRGLNAATIHSNLSQIWKESTQGYTTICRRINSFNNDEQPSFHDAHRSGRPRTSLVSSNVEQVNELITENPSWNVRDLASNLDISIGSTHSILRDDLNLRCVYSAWVPYSLSNRNKVERVQCAEAILQLFDGLGDEKFNSYAVEDETVILFDAPPSKRQSRVWIGKDEKRPQVVSKKLTRNKVMLTIAITCNKRISISAFHSGCVMNSEAYVAFLKETAHKWRNLRSHAIHFSSLHWQHDNARCHVSAITSDYICKSGLTLMKQAPYSPDLNLLDRWINQRIKDDLRGESFTSSANVVRATQRCLRNIPEDTYRNELLRLERQCKRIIDAGGDYITD